MTPCIAQISTLRSWCLLAILFSILGCAARESVHSTLAKPGIQAYRPEPLELARTPHRPTNPAVQMVGFQAPISNADELDLNNSLSVHPKEVGEAGDRGPAEKFVPAAEAHGGGRSTTERDSGNTSVEATVQLAPEVLGTVATDQATRFSVAEYVAMACATHPKIAAANQRLAAAKIASHRLAHLLILC